VALVTYSLGGFVLKGLAFEAHKQRNDLDAEVHKCSTFLNNVKGLIFFGVLHAGGIQCLSNYFIRQHQQINTLSKYATQFGFLRILESFNPQMEHLSVDFEDAIHEDVNIYAFGEGLPVNKEWVRFSFHTLKVIQLGSLVEHFLYCQNLCGIMYSILLNILMW
jgi:hypothetical protein